MNWFSKYTFNTLLIVAVGAIGFTAYKNKNVQVQTYENVPYEYSLKINDQTISSYRSPASKKISVDKNAKVNSWKDSTTSTESTKEEIENLPTINKNQIPSYAPSIVRTNVAPELERQIENNPTEFASDSSVDSEASTSSSSDSTTTAESGTTVTTGTAGTSDTTKPSLKFGPAGSSGSGSGTAPTIQTPALKGKITPLAGIIAQNSSLSLISAAYAANTCSNARVLLLDLTNMSILHNTAIKESTLSEDTKFDFDPVALKLNLDTPTRYMLETKGCTTNYQRIISSFYQDQDLDHSTTLVSKIVNTRIAGVLETISTESLQNFYDKIQKSSVVETDMEKVYEALNNTDELKAKFQDTFKGGSVFELTEAAPDVNEVKMFSDLKELETYNFAVDASHWSSQYQIGYEWKVDDVVKATTPTWNYIPSANSKPTQKITLVIGSKNTSDSLVNRTLPFHEINISATVIDGMPSTPPSLALNTASTNPTSTRAVVLEMNTGALSGSAYANCASFTSLAITENNAVPTENEFTITCNSGPQQLINYTLAAPADGIVSIKLWSKDAANRVTSTPVVLPVELDTTSPVIEFINFASGYISDESSDFKWKLTERNANSSQFFNLQFYNGSAWTNLPAVSLTNGPHAGTTFTTSIHLPNISTSFAKLRITYADTLGHTTTQESPVFEIQKPILSSNPLTLDMGQVNNKSLSSEYTLTFNNTGSAATKVCSPIALTGTHAAEFEIVSDSCNGQSIGATSCALGIKARPTQKGIRSATAVLTCNNDSFSTPITIESLNNAPAVSNLAGNAPEDSSTTINFGSINDIDGDVLTYTIVGSPLNGSISACQIVGADYVCTYTPNANYNGNDTLTFKANDGTADSATATVNLIILPINDAPTLAGPQSISTNEDTPITFGLLAGNDTENDVLQYIVVSTTSYGTLNCVGGTNSSCTYTPNANYNGSDFFTYKVSDGTFNSNIETVSITINDQNDPPVPAANQTLSTTEDTVLNFSINPGSDVDVPAQLLSYRVVTAPTKGTLSNCIATGSYDIDLSCTYTPDANENGVDTFTYMVYDTVTDSATNATITINIAADNDAPTLGATQSVFTPEDTVLNFNLNPGSDIEATALTYNIVTNPAVGTLTCTGGTSRACTYTPALDYVGSTTFTYRVSDGALNSTTATVTVNVAGDNDPPDIGANQAFSTNEDTALAFTINAATDIDVPAQTLSYKIISNPAKGTLSGCITDAAYGTVRNCTYTPNANVSGTDTFTYVANDGLYDSATMATITFSINAVNDVPSLAATQSVSTNEDTALTFNLNAGTDVEGSTLTYIKVTNTTNGTINCTAGTSQSCTYTPNANYNGTDTFTYKVNDGTADSTLATVTITVNAVNDAPVVAANQSVAVTEDTLATFTITAGTDIDVPAQTLSYILITAPTKGTLTNCITTGSYSTDRVCDYTPNANVNGSDTITYRVYDSLLQSVGTATVTFNIAAVNDTPTLAATQSVSTPEDTALAITLNAGADIDGNTLTYIKVANPTNGTVTCTGGTSRACTYTPNANFNGTDSFTYKVNDGTADSTLATVTITVTAVNDPPVMGSNQTFSIDDASNLAITLNTATDIDGGALTYKIITPPANGTLSACITTGAYGTDLVCNYISNGNFNGADTFTFQAFDTFTTSVAVATVTINVTDNTPAPAPTLALSSPVYTKVTGTTFTASSCTDTPSLFVNEGTAPTAGAAGWQSCSTTANAITYSLGTTPTQGLHTLKVWAKDAYGNVSTTSTNFSVYYDTVLPALTLTLPPAQKGGATYNLAWTATESYTTTSLLFTVEATTDGSTWTSVGTTASTAGPLSSTAFTRSWTVPSVNVATAKFRVTFTDRAGNTNTVTSAAFTIDSTAPALTITAPAANAYFKTSATMTGACETGVNVYFSGNLQADFNIACTGGTYSQLINFDDGDGNKTITVTQTDAVGNVTTVSRNFIRDEVAPMLAKTTGKSPDFTKNNIPNTWSGTCEGNYTVSVSGAQTTTFACTAGTWTWTPASKTVDGTYSYNLVQTDGAGNVSSPPLTLAWTRDATAPNFTTVNPIAGSAGQTKAITNNLSSLTFSGVCEGTNSIAITGTATGAVSCSSSSWSWTTPTVTTDGARSYTFKQTDSAGNISTIIVNWTRDTTGPALTIASTLLKTNTNTVTFSGGCSNGYNVEVTGAQTATATCTSGAWSFTTAANATDATRAYTFKQTFTASPFNSTTVTGSWIRKTTVPTVSAFTTSATNPSRSSYIPVNVSANSQSSTVYLSHLCIVSDSNTKPTATDSCFVAINGPDIAKPLAQTLSLSNYSILMGWTPKTYDIYVWVKDEAGNISDLTSAGVGTLATDKMNMSYDPGIPPTVWDVLASNIVNPPNPPTRAQTEVPAGTSVYIRWKAADNIALPAGAVSLSYTPDEINFTDIVSNLSNANYGCTGVTLASNEGCYKWNGGSPLNTAYKIRVKVTDAGDVSSQLISNPLNSGLIKIIAGNTESGLGGSAQTAMFYTRRVSDYSDPGSLVVTDNGQFFFADYKRGILTIDQSDGKQKIFIQATGTSTGDGGPAVNATLKFANKLALDYQGRLLILDQDRIRRVDLSLSTPTIETIIGGGTDTTDTVDDPLTVKIYNHSNGGGWDHNPVFLSTPNGDIYFQSDYAIKPASMATYRLRIYKAATDQVVSKYFTGTGDKYVPTQDLLKCRLMHPALAFDPNTSMLTGVSLTTNHDLTYTGCDQLAERYSRAYFDPDTFVAITPKDESLRHYSYTSYTGMDGNSYIHAARTYINRVNMDGTYTRVLGSGTRGTCVDGTAATACNIDVQNYFVSTSGKVYFTDRGVIRTVDENGNVKSLFGQNLIYGHGVAATNARFSDVGAVFRLANGKVITNDIAGEFIKEFSIEGNINIISGNGSTQNLSLTVDPTTNGMPDADWMTVNRVNGDIYASQTSMGYGIYAKLNRTTNRWENVVGSTTATTHYTDADNILGANILGTSSTAANRGLIVGFGNNELVISRMRQNLANGGRYEDMMYKTYDAADGFRQSHIAGVLGYPADSNVRRTCDATTAVLAATCEMPYWDTFFQFYWDNENTRWISGLVGSGSTKRDIYEFTAAGMIKKIGTTGADMSGAYVYVKLDGVENFYYCSSGKIRRYNLTTKTDLGVLAWSMTNLSCKGKTMDFNPTNRSIIFPFEQNGLNGVAEYFLP